MTKKIVIRENCGYWRHVDPFANGVQKPVFHSGMRPITSTKIPNEKIFQIRQIVVIGAIREWILLAFGHHDFIPEWDSNNHNYFCFFHSRMEPKIPKTTIFLMRMGQKSQKPVHSRWRFSISDVWTQNLIRE